MHLPDGVLLQALVECVRFWLPAWRQAIRAEPMPRARWHQEQFHRPLGPSGTIAHLFNNISSP